MRFVAETRDRVAAGVVLRAWVLFFVLGSRRKRDHARDRYHRHQRSQAPGPTVSLH